MDGEDFEQVLSAFVHAAVQAKAIDCDGVEIHGAHGYLLDSFLNPVVNRRNDSYGGSVENRMRFPLCVVCAVREAVGAGFPIIYRFSQWRVDDYREIKWKTPDELALWVAALREAGVDLLDVSTRNALAPAFEGSRRTLAAWAKDLSELPVIAVGTVSLALAVDEPGEVVPPADPGPVFELVEKGEVDLIGVGRALIANPDWVRVVRDGDWRNLRPYTRAILSRLE